MSNSAAPLIDAVYGVAQATFSWQGAMWLATTLLVYAGALYVNRLCKGSPIAHPLALTALGVGALLAVTHTPPADYQLDASLLHFLLGPATVALALPMYGQWEKIRHLGWRLVAAIAVGGVVAPVTAWLAMYLADATLALQMTMLVKSITSPLAMEASALIGGIPALAAVFVIITGIVGAIAAPLTFSLCKVEDPSAQGVALGSVCHAVGTSKAIHMGQEEGAMATLGLCINGVMTAFILPTVIPLFI